MSELKWGIEITVPSKVKGKTKKVLYSDKTGTRIFTSRSKATDFIKNPERSRAGSRCLPMEVDPKPRVVRVKVTVSKVKPSKPYSDGKGTFLNCSTYPKFPNK